jgi:hypothetical protein
MLIWHDIAEQGHEQAPYMNLPRVLHQFLMKTTGAQGMSCILWRGDYLYPKATSALDVVSSTTLYIFQIY